MTEIKNVVYTVLVIFLASFFWDALAQKKHNWNPEQKVKRFTAT